ncbi:putative F-box domain-containing protein [Helianthus anomalus]
MANVGDNVLHNIFARLPGKPLLRFRCVSKHWNGLISDPYFMKSRSRRMILSPFLRGHLVAIDDHVPAEDEVHTIVRIRSPLEHHGEGTQVVSMVGTFNGIVLLALTDELLCCQLILYNPLTRASKILLVLDGNIYDHPPFVFGFGYGATEDDLKLVSFKVPDYPDRHRYKCDVFDLKTSSRGTSQYLYRHFQFSGDVGMFINGFLCWTASFVILALNIKEMVFSKVKLPYGIEYASELLLGSIGGCLCVINKIGTTGFDVWLLKEECTWMKAHSFTFGLEGNCFKVFNPICILENGKILMTNSSIQLVLYDTSNDSYKTLNGMATLDDFKRINTISDFKKMYNIPGIKDMRSIGYVESLVKHVDTSFI